MEDILKKNNAANTDNITGNSVNIIRKYLNEKNLPVDIECLDDKALDELLSNCVTSRKLLFKTCHMSTLLFSASSLREGFDKI